MKSRWITLALCAVIAAILIARLLPHRPNHTQADQPARARANHGNPYLGLRGLVLQSTRANFGLSPGSSANQPFALVSDWVDPDGTTTIIAIADGSASVYRSNGPGSIGGGQSHESIRKAALQAVAAADAAQPQMHRTSEFPLPAHGQVCFYAVSDAGVFTAAAAQEDLRNNRSPLSALAAAAQDIASQYERVTPGR